MGRLLGIDIFKSPVAEWSKRKCTTVLALSRQSCLGGRVSFLYYQGRPSRLALISSTLGWPAGNLGTGHKREGTFQLLLIIQPIFKCASICYGSELLIHFLCEASTWCLEPDQPVHSGRTRFPKPACVTCRTTFARRGRTGLQYIPLVFKAHNPASFIAGKGENQY